LTDKVMTKVQSSIENSKIKRCVIKDCELKNPQTLIFLKSIF